MGCGVKTQVVQKVEIEKLKIPTELLELKPLQKPFVKDEKDILKAYTELFKAFKECEININEIKRLNE